jgi:hypothetical protein
MKTWSPSSGAITSEPFMGVPVPFAASNAASVVSGFVSRPQPDAVLTVVQAVASFLMNQSMPLTVMLTVPTSDPLTLVTV